MAAGLSMAMMLIVVINAACIAGTLAIIVRRQPSRGVAGVIALWIVSVACTAVLSWQIGRLEVEYEQTYGLSATCGLRSTCW